MKKTTYRQGLYSAILASLALSTGTVSAATLQITNQRIAEGNIANTSGHYGVSVFGGQLSFNGPTSGVVVAPSAVRDWAFYNGGNSSNDAMNPVPFELATYSTGSAGRIQSPAAAAGQSAVRGETGSNGGDNRLNFWVTTDPGSTFSSPADFIGGDGTTVSNGDTTARLRDASITIDLSGLTTGSVFVFRGGFNNGSNVQTLNAVLSDGSATMTESYTFAINDIAGTRGTEAAIVNFDTSGGFDTLTITHDTVGNSGSRSRFAGLVVTGEQVPEPGSTLLLGLSVGILALRRNR